MTERLGELAALGTALSWTATALFFEAASRRLGSVSLNFLRLVLALGFFVPASLVLFGHPLPVAAPLEIWGWLSVSALLGFVIGDMALFRAFLIIGPRASVTLMSLAPLVGAVIGWGMLGEVLEAREWAGMALTLGGVVLVVRDRPSSSALRPAGGAAFWGVVLGLIAAVGQASGLVFSKQAMLLGIDPFRATLIRILSATILFLPLFTVIGWWPKVRGALRETRGLAYAAGGAFFGPFLGVNLSLLAVRWTDTGVAMTLMALLPVTTIPAVILVRKEEVGAIGWIGAVLASGGAALLLL